MNKLDVLYNKITSQEIFSPYAGLPITTNRGNKIERFAWLFAALCLHRGNKASAAKTLRDAFELVNGRPIVAPILGGFNCACTCDFVESLVGTTDDFGLYDEIAPMMIANFRCGSYPGTAPPAWKTKNSRVWTVEKNISCALERLKEEIDEYL